MAEGQSEASDWLSDFSLQVSYNQHLCMADDTGETSTWQSGSPQIIVDRPGYFIRFYLYFCNQIYIHCQLPYCS